MESSRSSTQTMTMISSNIVETFLYMPFLKASGITINLLVQMNVVHNFLWIPESTLATLPSTVQNGIKPFFHIKNDDHFF